MSLRKNIKKRQDKSKRISLFININNIIIK